MSFKLGDKVRIISNSNHSLNCVGDIGTLVKGCSLEFAVDTGDGRSITCCNTQPRDMVLHTTTIRFQDLKENIVYSCVVGGAIDHGYEYELRKGRVYNLSKSRYSTMPFNTKTYFTELDTFRPEQFKLGTLEYAVKLRRASIIIGCQTIALSDVETFCNKMEEKYGFKA